MDLIVLDDMLFEKDRWLKIFQKKRILNEAKQQESRRCNKIINFCYL